MQGNGKGGTEYRMIEGGKPAAGSLGFALRPYLYRLVRLRTIGIDKVQTSCGFGVPFYNYEGERDQMQKWALNKGEDGLDAYKKEKNMFSLDGLPTALYNR